MTFKQFLPKLLTLLILLTTLFLPKTAVKKTGKKEKKPIKKVKAKAKKKDEVKVNDIPVEEESTEELEKKELSQAEIYDDYELPPLVQTLEELEAEFSQYLFLKAKDGGRIVGSVRAREQEGTCHIARLMVHPSAQGKGLGQRIMAAIEAEFAGAKLFELFTGSLSHGNLHLYAKLGYELRASTEVSPKLTVVTLQKPGPHTP